MPHWNCERCGARLYSASKNLKRNNCPVCQGRLSPQGDVRSDRFEQAKRAAMGLPEAVEHGVDVPENR